MKKIYLSIVSKSLVSFLNNTRKPLIAAALSFNFEQQQQKIRRNNNTKKKNVFRNRKMKESLIFCFNYHK